MDKILRGKFSLACTGCSLLLLGSLGTEGDEMLILKFQNCSYCSYRCCSYSYSYSSYRYRYCSFSISERHLMKKPLILREITKYYSADSFLGGNAQKQVSVAFRANNIIFGQKTFQIHDGKSEEWVAVGKNLFSSPGF